MRGLTGATVNEASLWVNDEPTFPVMTASLLTHKLKLYWNLCIHTVTSTNNSTHHSLQNKGRQS